MHPRRWPTKIHELEFSPSTCSQIHELYDKTELHDKLRKMNKRLKSTEIKKWFLFLRFALRRRENFDLAKREWMLKIAWIYNLSIIMIVEVTKNKSINIISIRNVSFGEKKNSNNMAKPRLKTLPIWRRCDKKMKSIIMIMI